ncbi:hypothetical protein [Sphingomonas sp. MMS24-J13]|uniref:hypothetical protein n=1 Tax=Sphingomonas sp. MMS24-J13 TaxID=3238686 RepID=UPI003850B41D
MTASLSNGETYQGPYFQITRETHADTLSPLWFGWEGRGRWRGWSGWGPDEITSTTYSPRVFANLQKPSGEHMRCRFTLARPGSGMAGGGQGRCQLADGTVIDTDFPQH